MNEAPLTVNAYGCDPATIPQDHADRVARALGLPHAVRIGCGGFLWGINPGLTITQEPFDLSNPRIVSVPWGMIERLGDATAWLHHVVSDGGEPDLALSFYRDSFPLDGVAGYRSISAVPLYTHSPTPTPPPAGGVPGNAHLLSPRLRELADAVTRGAEGRGEFTMRIPAEPDRDADLVLSRAAFELDRQAAKIARLRAEVEAQDAAIAALRMDAERVDFLELLVRHLGDGYTEPREASIDFYWQQSSEQQEYPGLRAAIDAARNAEGRSDG